MAAGIHPSQSGSALFLASLGIHVNATRYDKVMDWQDFNKALFM
jgi:anthranilate phosphoribosyltransferase